MKNLVTYKMFESKVRPVITYDFDGVLHTGVWPGTIHPLPDASRWLPSARMIDKMKDESKDHDIFIVTARDGDSNGKNQEVEKFVIDNNLPVKGIICTNDESKLPYLKDLKSVKHYDDNKNMARELEGSGIEFVLVDPTNITDIK